jgi:hypothetical protein
MPSETLPRWECKRCHHRWIPRREGIPVRCPGCKSPYWNRAGKVPAADPMAAKFRALDEGIAYYEAHQDEIEREHMGKFVGVTKDGVIDADENYSDLADRIFANGAFSLLIRKVGEPRRVVHFRPRFRVVRS